MGGVKRMHLFRVVFATPDGVRADEILSVTYPRLAWSTYCR